MKISDIQNEYLKAYQTPLAFSLKAVYNAGYYFASISQKLYVYSGHQRVYPNSSSGTLNNTSNFYFRGLMDSVLSKLGNIYWDETLAYSVNESTFSINTIGDAYRMISMPRHQLPEFADYDVSFFFKSFSF